ncbi:type II secretion system minor pseudopilin GspK [Yersinia enterocolitica]|uniref:type II secretion system minor pseudopilin GspK n=1 Tax=Yersinia enterocolitica TaxID=630 RepID=UPI003AB23C6B
MREQQQGVALLVVLLILALMTAISSSITVRYGQILLRSLAQFEYKQAKWYALGAEALAEKILQADFRKSPNKTDLTQNWAQQEHQFLSEWPELIGQIEDAQACFNINSLNQRSTSYPDRVFLQLLKNLGIEPLQATQVTIALRDRFDNDRAILIRGDEVYMTQNSPYLATNQPMQDISELRTISGIDSHLYRQLLPYICTLPNQRLLVNVNTLHESKGVLLSALFLNKLAPSSATQLLQQRPQEGWESVSEFLALQQLQGINTSVSKEVLSVKSDFFQVYISSQLENEHVMQYSLLQRTGNNVHVVWRKYGLSMMVMP